MAHYRVRLRTTIEVEVTLPASSDDEAADLAWEVADDFTDRLGSQTGDPRITAVTASFDGIGADDVDELAI